MDTERPSDRFLEFLADYKKILFAFLGLGAAPPILSIAIGVGPPWPQATGVAYFTMLVIWLVLPWSYVANSHVNQTLLRARFALMGGVITVALIFYVGLAAVFLYDAPDSRNQEASGFLLQDKIRQTLAKAERKGLPLTLQDLVDGEKYNPKEIWVPWTVDVSRIALLISWLVLFGGLSTLTATLIRFLEAEASEQQDSKLTPHIATLSLSRRVRESLEEAGVRTIADLTKRRREEVLAISGIGGKALEEVEECLTGRGLSLRES